MSDIGNIIAFLFEVGTSILILWGIGRMFGAVATFFGERKRKKLERQEEEKREAERRKMEAEIQQQEAKLNEIAAQWEKHLLFSEIFTMCDSAIQHRVTLIKTGAYSRADDYRYGAKGEKPMPWNECKCAVGINAGLNDVTVYDKSVWIIYNEDWRYTRYAFEEKYEAMNHPFQREGLLRALYRNLSAKYNPDRDIEVTYSDERIGYRYIIVNFTSLLPHETVQRKIPLPR